MIITVTLNTAIDKTLSVPNFRLGRRHRTVEQTTMPGGKGVNVARVLKTLGAPVIATGFTGGPTGTRIVDQLTQLSVLSDFVRIREESRTNTAVIDPGSRPRSTSAARRSPSRRSSCSSTSCSTWPRARPCACSPARSRARSTSTSTPG
jgi:fructose-1-phosphate kinase PfkB-like protein